MPFIARHLKNVVLDFGALSVGSLPNKVKCERRHAQASCASHPMQSSTGSPATDRDAMVAVLIEQVCSHTAQALLVYKALIQDHDLSGGVRRGKGAMVISHTCFVLKEGPAGWVSKERPSFLFLSGDPRRGTSRG
jgi:hypothetical protein